MGMQKRDIIAPNGVQTTVLVNDEDVEEFDAAQKEADDARAAKKAASSPSTKARKTAENK